MILAAPATQAGKTASSANRTGKNGRFPFRMLAAAIAIALAGGVFYLVFA